MTTTDTRSKYAVDGKCFYCGKPTGLLYCNSECQDKAMKEGGECIICGLLTRKGELFCSQECEDDLK